MLREITDLQPLALVAPAAFQSKRARKRFHQRRFTRAIGAEQTDLVAIEQTPFDVVQNVATAVGVPIA